tara:strand:+ start:21 stop:1049 length:1029 start_codon:yes stop_codon:yes gene_type:complete
METNYIFKLTATPTNSQLGKLLHDGKLKVKIINKLPPKKLTIDRLACLNKKMFYDPDISGDIDRSFNGDKRIRLSDVEKKVLMMLKDMRELELETGAKQTMLIRTGISTSKEFYTKPNIVKNMVKGLVKLAGFDPTELILGITTEGGQHMESASGKNSQDVINDIQLQKHFDDPDHPVRIMLVINKCYQGMSVNSIKNVVVWRTTSTEDSSGDPITDFGMQVIGRGNRPYAGRHKLKNHTFDSLKHLPLEEKKGIIKLNSLNFLLPNTFNYHTIAQMFSDTMISTKEEFTEYFLDGESNIEHICEEDPCIRCGGTGVEPKDNIIDDDNFDGIEEELQIENFD